MDRRAARSEHSRAVLKAAFLELFLIKEPEEITVVELCRKAGRNRSTFYAHYEYMDQLVREVLRETVENIFIDLGSRWDLPMEKDGGIDRQYITAYLRRFLNDPTARRFCTCAGSANYLTLLIRAHVDLTLPPVKVPARYCAAYFQYAGVLNLLLEWLNSENPVPEETIVDLIHEFSKVMYRPWQ